MKKEDLYTMYNATSTDNPPDSDDLETYESWLERQLISRLTRIKVGDIVSEIENHTDLSDRTDCIHVVTYVRPFDHGEYFEIGLSGYEGSDEKFSEFEVYPIPGSAIVTWLEKVGSFVGGIQMLREDYIRRSDTADNMFAELEKIINDDSRPTNDDYILQARRVNVKRSVYRTFAFELLREQMRIGKDKL